VRDNVAFGLEMQKLETVSVDGRVRDLLHTMDLAGFEARRVTDLSGGEQQRVALARMLAPGPRLMMFDEPLGALDRSLRDQLIEQLRKVLHQSGIPAIYVTHDQEEALTIADRVLILHEGKIVQSGSPGDVFRSPANGWVARFLGLGNVLGGVIAGKRVHTDMGEFALGCVHSHYDGEQVEVLIRPAAASLGSGKSPDAGSLSGRVSDVFFYQNGYKVVLENGMYFYLSECPQAGEMITLRVLEVECLQSQSSSAI
jgi:ABC-type Fe3+/spermidine/putrescine transport system ATPase subunit